MEYPERIAREKWIISDNRMKIKIVQLWENRRGRRELNPRFVRATKLNYEFYPAMTEGHHRKVPIDIGTAGLSVLRGTRITRIMLIRKKQSA